MVRTSDSIFKITIYYVRSTKYGLEKPIQFDKPWSHTPIQTNNQNFPESTHVRQQSKANICL